MQGPEINAAGGIRDCGRFFLDFAGLYARDEVDISWLDDKRPSNAKVDAIIDQTWQEQTADKGKSGKELFDGDLCRLLQCRAGEKLSIALGPVGFKDFLGTNLTNARLRYEHGMDILADALGVSAAVRTADGFLLMGLRSESVAFHSGRLHPIGGVVEPDMSLPQPADPFDAMILELEEETALTRDMISDIVCMGLVRDKLIVQPELIFDVSISIEAIELRKISNDALGKNEHTHLELISDHPARITAFIRANFEKLTAVAIATLLLHGLRHWGCGWFTTTRGYLKSMY